MMYGKRCIALSAALAAFSAATSNAQSVFDSEVRLAPQFVQYRFMAPANETVWQLALPVFVTIPVNERLTFDVGTSFARTRVTADGAASDATAGASISVTTPPSIIPTKEPVSVGLGADGVIQIGTITIQLPRPKIP